MSLCKELLGVDFQPLAESSREHQIIAYGLGCDRSINGSCHLPNIKDPQKLINTSLINFAGELNK